MLLMLNIQRYVMLAFSLMAQQGDWIPPPPSNDVLDVLNLDAVHPFQFPPHKRHRNRPSANGPGYSSTDRDRYSADNGSILLLVQI